MYSIEAKSLDERVRAYQEQFINHDYHFASLPDLIIRFSHFKGLFTTFNPDAIGTHRSYCKDPSVTFGTRLAKNARCLQVVLVSIFIMDCDDGAKYC